MKKLNGELEIDEDMKLEQRTWTVQRISCVIMFLIIVWALRAGAGWQV